MLTSSSLWLLWFHSKSAAQVFVDELKYKAALKAIWSVVMRNISIKWSSVCQGKDKLKVTEELLEP